MGPSALISSPVWPSRRPPRCWRRLSKWPQMAIRDSSKWILRKNIQLSRERGSCFCSLHFQVNFTCMDVNERHLCIPDILAINNFNSRSCNRWSESSIALLPSYPSNWLSASGDFLFKQTHLRSVNSERSCTYPNVIPNDTDSTFQ